MADGHIPQLQHQTRGSAVQVLPFAPIEGEPAAPADANDPLDRIGVGISLGCAVHCAATGALSLAPALVPAAIELPAAGLIGWLELLEWPFLLGAAAVGIVSLLPAFRRHQERLPLGMFSAGMTLIGASRFVHGPLEIALTTCGVACVATAHLLNLRASRHARVCVH